MQPLKLYPFQELGIQWLLKHPRTLFADEQGLGKTCQALLTLDRSSSWPALVVCPASLRLNWVAEVGKWLPGRTFQLWDTTRAHRHADIIITHYEVLARFFPELAGLTLKAMVFDEAHALKHRKSQRSKAALALIRTQSSIQLPAPRVLLLSGTPLENRPIELEHPLDLLGKLDPVFGGSRAFQFRYCDRRLREFRMRGRFVRFWDVSGAKNLPELHRQLQGIMLRRTKREVLSQLPEKRRIDVLLSVDLREYRKAEADLIEWIRKNAGDEAARRATRAEQLVRVAKLKQLAIEAKSKAVFDWIDEAIDEGQKIVVFAHSRDLQAALRVRYPQAAYVVAEQSLIVRQASIDGFQRRPEVPLLIASLEVAGQGFTITAASTVVFTDLGDWTPQAYLQAEDRLHRIGQTKSVSCYYLLAAQTIEESIMKMLRAKIEVTSTVMEGRSVPLLDSLVTLLGTTNPATLRVGGHNAQRTSP